MKTEQHVLKLRRFTTVAHYRGQGKADSRILVCGLDLHRIWDFPKNAPTIWLTGSVKRQADAIPIRFRYDATNRYLYWSERAQGDIGGILLYTFERRLFHNFPHLKKPGVHKLWVRLEYLDAPERGI